MRYLIIFLLLIRGAVFAQSDFSIPPQACLQENIRITNLSVNGIAYEWDFCSGDLSLIPTASISVNSYGGYGTKVKIIEQNGAYYGFFIGRAAGKLFRLDFGVNINSQPRQVDLGGFGINSATWRAVEIIKEGTDYYGFIIDSNANTLSRFSLGTDLMNTPSSLEVVYTGELNSAPFDITSINESGSRFIFIANLGNEKLTRIRFSSSFGGSPASTTIDNITIAGSNGLSGISFIKELDSWYCGVTSVSTSRVYKISFGSNLSNTLPVISSITGFSISAPAGISLAIDNGRFYFFIQSDHASPLNSLYRLDFGASLSNIPAFTDFKNFGVVTASGMFGFSMYKAKSKWLVLSTESAGSNIFKITFPNNCFSTTEYSSAFEPSVTASISGSYSVSLSTLDEFGGKAHQSKSISITTNQSPDIAFTPQNLCANHDINFTSSNNSGDVMDYAWDFGDTKTSIQQNPVTQYTNAGDYEVSLEVIASNGCKNLVKQNISIYKEPLANFNLPFASPYCTNQSYFFENTSVTDPGYPVTWQWSVNGVSQASSKDFEFAFDQTTNQDIKLTASIPGCENLITKGIPSLSQGPVVDFSFTGQCEDVDIPFTNNSSGTVTSYVWDFDDGQNSTAADPTHIFSDIGMYNVTLTGNSAAGCNNTLSKSVNVYSKPVVTFDIEAPPFSCNGTNSMFINSTSNPVDSNVTGWLWDFGDAGSSSNTSLLKIPQHLYNLFGDYTVSLKATTNFGCESILQKTITIWPSPAVNFSNTPPCQDVDINFTDLSANAQSWNWQIGTSFYTSQNPTHKFINAGTYPVALTVAASNGCIGSRSKSIVVPSKLSPNFSFTKNCVGEETLFTDITNDAADPVVERRWTINGTQFVSVNATTPYTFANTGIYATSLAVTTQTGCVTTPFSKNVSVGAKPLAGFIASPEIGGGPLTVQFSNTSTGAISYAWKFNDATNSTSTLINPKFIFSELGEYNVELSAFNAQQCSGTFTKLIQVVKPLLNIALTRLDLIETISGSIKPEVTIVNSGNVPISNMTLHVDISGNASIREIVSVVISPGSSLKYTMPFEINDQALLNFVCVNAELVNDTDNRNNRICENVQSTSFFIPPYPNPANTIVQVEWMTNTTVLTSLSLTNQLGDEMLQFSFEPEKGFNHLSLDVAELSNGIYLLTLKHPGFRKTYRILVSH